MYHELLKYSRLKTGTPIPYGYDLASPGIVIQIVGGRIVDVGVASKGLRPVLVPKLPAKRSSKPVAQLATDTLEYTLGTVRDSKSPERHQKFMARLREAVHHTDSPLLQAMEAAILQDGPALRAGEGTVQIPRDVSLQALAVTLIDGEHVHDDPLIQTYWQQLIQEHGRPGEDGVSELPGLYTDRLPATASARVLGKKGKRETAMLASANQPAFHNYGLVNSFGTGLTAQTADELGKAINSLLSDPKHTIALEAASLIFWTTHAAEWSLDWLMDPQPEDVQRLFSAPFTTAAPALLEPSDFQGLLLGSNTARLVVLGQLRLPLAEAQDRVRAFLRRLQVPDRRAPEKVRTFGIRTLLRDLNGTDGPKGAALPPGLDEALLRHALTGAALPAGTVTLLATRAKTPKHVVPALAAFAQLALLSTGTLQEDFAMHDPPTPADLAYRVGQLLALAGDIQRQAIGNVNTSVADTYFGLASRNPSQAVGLILTNTTVHLKKIRRSSPGLAAHFDARLKELTAPFTPGQLPTALTPEQQTAFTLGYYHQLHTPGGRT